MSKRRWPTIGDKVKILRPEIFIRCGYPIDLLIERESIFQEHGKKIEDFIRSLFGTNHKFNIDHTTMEIARALAYYQAKTTGFGGKERKIYTETMEHLQDSVMYVIGRRTVKTGIYQPASHTTSWDGDDWEAPYLANEETHVILKLGRSQVPWKNYYECEIEAKNVVIIE
jgi:hypothetical protein